MSKKIACIYSGGTMGMLPSAQGLQPDAGFPDRLRAALSAPELAVISLSPLIDSASATPEQWQQLADTVCEHQAAYDGFVIIHGTDTLAYSAAAMANMLEGFGKPVVLTGSQYPLGTPESDALNNMRGALAAAQDSRSTVGVFFYDRLMDGKSVRKVHAQSPQAFCSVNSEDWAHWCDGQLHWLENLGGARSMSAYLQRHWQGFQSQSVAMLWITPDMPQSVFMPVLTDPTIKALVLVSFGSGNVPERTDLQQALSNAVARGVRIINVTQCLGGRVEQDTYAAGAASLGVESGDYLTPEAAFVRLHIDLASNSIQ
ncbi:asparaginase [Suttonella sp. R2A3]|uniref:asparaginase n=1 Tax=Suttonella sp. R2A3 TaxID=2908648 RepID=UPI001F42F972|nr:asparaginase [Suttonella sp. R2A3]UJF24800.1 asparaginase [Suttonella sp. R2A3]